MTQIIKSFLVSLGIFHQKKGRVERIMNFLQSDVCTSKIDIGIYFFSVFGPATTIPQILKIFQTGDISGLSLFTWIAYLVLTFFWFAYGYIHRDTPILLTQTLWIIMYTTVVLQIVYFSI